MNRSQKDNGHLSFAKILKFINASKTLKDSIEHYERRPAQEKMIEKVVEMLNFEKIYLCEAPTGTGKSLAYLIPSLIWAQKKNAKIVIATRTINLQEQLLKKDIEIASKVFKNSLTPLLVKGKNNFLCYRKYQSHKKKPNLFSYSNEEETQKILNWAQETTTGDKNELPFVPKNDLWQEFACENEYCRINRCQFKNRCFQIKNRYKIAKSNILIVNHHLLLSDLKLKSETKASDNFALLPNYEILIIDEAHHLEEIASLYFSDKTSLHSIINNLSAVMNFSKRGRLASGLLKKIEVDLKLPKGKFKVAWKIFLKEIHVLVNQFLANVPLLNKTINEFIKMSQRDFFYKNKVDVLIDEDFYQLVHQQKKFHNAIEKLVNFLTKISHRLERVFSFLAKIESSNPDMEWHLLDLSAQLGAIKRELEVFEHFLTQKRNDLFIKWISFEKKTHKNDEAIFWLTPLWVKSELKELLFAKLKKILLTSATLSTGKKNFNFTLSQLGLEVKAASGEIAYDSLPFSFDYRKNCRLFIPKNFPETADKTFITKSLALVLQITRFLQGKTLVLFTSKEQLNSFKEQLQASSLKEIKILTQGDLPQYQLLNELKRNSQCILLGLDSFWEGVDVKGENLSALIMTKLPFSTPSNPIIKAKMNDLTQKGENAFSDYYLPKAIIKFKQGFGRLIRSTQDRGIFILLDSRVMKRSYGKAFLEALPPMKIETENLKSVLSFLKKQ